MTSGKMRDIGDVEQQADVERNAKRSISELRTLHHGTMVFQIQTAALPRYAGRVQCISKYSRKASRRCYEYSNE